MHVPEDGYWHKRLSRVKQQLVYGGDGEDHFVREVEEREVSVSLEKNGTEFGHYCGFIVGVDEKRRLCRLSTEKHERSELTFITNFLLILSLWISSQIVPHGNMNTEPSGLQSGLRTNVKRTFSSRNSLGAGCWLRVGRAYSASSPCWFLSTFFITYYDVQFGGNYIGNVVLHRLTGFDFFPYSSRAVLTHRDHVF